jgi:hypothetical protein
MDTGSGQNLIPGRLSPENASMFLGEGSLDAEARYLRPEKPVLTQPPDEIQTADGSKVTVTDLPEPRGKDVPYGEPQ